MIYGFKLSAYTEDIPEKIDWLIMKDYIMNTEIVTGGYPKFVNKTNFINSLDTFDLIKLKLDQTEFDYLISKIHEYIEKFNDFMGYPLQEGSSWII